MQIIRQNWTYQKHPILYTTNFDAFMLYISITARFFGSDSC